MGNQSIIDLLRDLEWAESVPIYLEDLEVEATLPGCPDCRGLKECPPTVRVGNEYSGWVDMPVDPDAHRDVGHRPGCRLEAALVGISQDATALRQAFCSVTEMWSRRYDTDEDQIPEVEEGEPFGCPVVVDLGLLSQAQTSLLVLVHSQLPELHKRFTEGGIPDAPLKVQNPTVVSLDDHRIRSEEEFKDEQVAYMEALWGKETFAFNIAIRDLERMRRGIDDKTLRPPETYHEMHHMILHMRALANDIARLAGMEELVRPDDDIREVENGG